MVYIKGEEMAKIQTSLRIEEQTLQEAKTVLKKIGLNFSEAVNIFAAMVVREKGLPFDLTAEEYPAIGENEAREKVRKAFDSMKEKRGVEADSFFSEMLNR